MDPTEFELSVFGFDTDRAKFRHLIGKEIIFCGSIQRFGHRNSYQNQKTINTILLTGLTVYYEEEQFDIGHLWIDRPIDFWIDKPGEIVYGKAIVGVYRRIDGTGNFRLKKITKLM